MRENSSVSALFRRPADGLGKGFLIDVGADIIFQARHVLAQDVLVVGLLELIDHLCRGCGIGLEGRYLDISDAEDHALVGLLARSAAGLILRKAENLIDD